MVTTATGKDLIVVAGIAVLEDTEQALDLGEVSPATGVTETFKAMVAAAVAAAAMVVTPVEDIIKTTTMQVVVFEIIAEQDYFISYHCYC